LKLAHEMPVVALLGRPEGPAFEASCIHKRGEFFYVVSDDVPAIGKIHDSLQYGHSLNTLIQPQPGDVSGGTTTEGGFEALFYDHATDTFQAVVEAVYLGGAPNVYHSVVHELRFNPDNTYTTVNTCPADFVFTAANKGFEGAIRVEKPNGDAYMLGLCEGNFCQGGNKGRTTGNGRIIVLKRVTNARIEGIDQVFPCVWQTQRVVHIPKSVDFIDYSAIALRAPNRIAIASQESSKIWIGHMDMDTFELITSSERVMNLPRDDDCNVVYCNVEGVDWLDESMLVAASDQMKDGGRQSFHCLAKDQSVHVFVIPPKAE